MEQRRNWVDPGRGEEIVYMGGPRIAHCKDYKTYFMASPPENKNQATGNKRKQHRDFSLLTTQTSSCIKELMQRCAEVTHPSRPFDHVSACDWSGGLCAVINCVTTRRVPLDMCTVFQLDPDAPLKNQHGPSAGGSH